MVSESKVDQNSGGNNRCADAAEDWRVANLYITSARQRLLLDFRRSDWRAFWICFLVVFAVYAFTNAPTVTFEDSGELAVAADYLGVPHPPGYPVWTLFAWGFRSLFRWVEFRGYPNPAWGTGLSSGFFGALTCALLALLVSRSGRDIARNIDGRHLFPVGLLMRGAASTAGITAGLMLAFSPVLWSQSTIIEVYSLNAAFLMGIIVLLYVWFIDPADIRVLWAIAFLFGLGLTNHHTLLFFAPALAAAIYLVDFKGRHDPWIALGMIIIPPVFIPWALAKSFLKDRKGLFHASVVLGVLMALLIAANFFLNHLSAAEPYSRENLSHLAWTSGPAHPGFWIWTGLAVLFPVLAAMHSRHKTAFSISVLCAACIFLLNGILLSPVSGWAWSFNPATPGFWLWTLVTITAMAVPWLLPFRLRRITLAAVFVLILLLAEIWARVKGYPHLLINPSVWSVPIIWIITGIAFWILNLFSIPRGRDAGIMLLLVLLGLSFYAMLPIASEQNPPMNWGYTRTWQGFLQTVSRSQYEPVQPLSNLQALFSNPAIFLRQLSTMVFHPTNYVSVFSQFMWFVALLGLIPFFYIRSLSVKFRGWLVMTLIAFISFTALFVLFHFPRLDRVFLFVGRVQYIPAHIIMALWVGYGLMFAMAAFRKSICSRRGVMIALHAVILLLPTAQLIRNAYDNRLLERVGSSDQSGHDFGWQFGYHQLRGAAGILDGISEEERGSYPNPAYPPAMAPNAILFGGTDAGRFIPTYMVFSANVRPDIFVLTQHALADSTYRRAMRDLYGDNIWLPSSLDSAEVFRDVLASAGETPAPGGTNQATVSLVVRETETLASINEQLARLIFERNRYQQSAEIVQRFDMGEDLTPLGVRVVEVGNEQRPVREFYVEASMSMPWMIPYLEPHGLIMRLNPQPVELDEEIINNDRSFWDWYSNRLLADRKFHRNLMARKNFAALRMSIASLYAARGLADEAEYAALQAIDIYPLHARAYLLLAELYLDRRDYSRAMGLMESWLQHDPTDERIIDYIDTIIAMAAMDSQRRQLEARLILGHDLDMAEHIELLNTYLVFSMADQFAKHLRYVLTEKPLSENDYLILADLCLQLRRLDLLEEVLLRKVETHPANANALTTLAAVQMTLNNIEAAMDTAETAISLGGEPIRELIAEDPRFAPLRDHPDFDKRILPHRND